MGSADAEVLMVVHMNGLRENRYVCNVIWMLWYCDIVKR